MTESDYWWLLALVFGLGMVQIMQSKIIRKLQDNVEFALIVARETEGKKS